MRTSLILVACSLLLGACSAFENPRPWPSERRLLAKDWVVPQVEPEMDPLYCYRTLGQPDCYAAPQPQADNRKVSSYGTNAR